MKPKCVALVCLLFLVGPFSGRARAEFDIQEYRQFLNDNQNLSSQELLARCAPRNTYYSEITTDSPWSQFSYADSVRAKYDLTQAELELLKKHHFVVTERLSYHSFGSALHDIYGKDLPVFITTDAILQALHASYDRILMDLEFASLRPKLVQLLDALYEAFPQLLSSYQGNADMHSSLADVDLYITIPRSLLAEEKAAPHFASPELVDGVWDAIQAEGYVEMPLFSERNRRLDFSQFTPRGHYTHEHWGYTPRTLRSYFKAMMWLGRIDFLLTPPPADPPWTKEEIRRMCLGAVLLDELLDLANARAMLDEIDEPIRFLVGESDNLTPAGLVEILASLNIQRADELLDDTRYDAFQEALLQSPESGQKILSSIFIMDPFSSEPDTLPASFRLLGQRFIVDSYIFSNVVYDRIVYNGQKIWRPMPDPLDAMFALGNDDTVQLLEEELNTYHYSSQLLALRYLVDAYDADFWDISLYNVWLQAIRLLNPPEDRTGFPLFMKTVAWQQEKLNTQLASWAQLRHDNLLYAKQSYTGGTVCSFPHSFVEPYPAFYRQIAGFGQKAASYFSEAHVQRYFQRLESVMDTLSNIAQKELDRSALSDEEEIFLKRMLFENGETGGSGAPPFTGWYGDLFYDVWDAYPLEPDFVVADVHTQPTDQSGAVVGRVLHVGVGEINLGIFLADAPSADFQPMAFVGPVMSYYEKITTDFDRLTDERWKELVWNRELPARPDWTNVYLADEAGNARPTGRVLHGQMYTNVEEPTTAGLPTCFLLSQNYPNPFNPLTTISYDLPRAGHATVTIYAITGQRLSTLASGPHQPGRHHVLWDGSEFATGVYFCRLKAGQFAQTKRMVLLK